MQILPSVKTILLEGNYLYQDKQTKNRYYNLFGKTYEINWNYSRVFRLVSDEEMKQAFGVNYEKTDNNQ